jgi:hypothetical protein
MKTISLLLLALLSSSLALPTKTARDSVDPDPPQQPPTNKQRIDYFPIIPQQVVADTNEDVKMEETAPEPPSLLSILNPDGMDVQEEVPSPPRQSLYLSDREKLDSIQHHHTHAFRKFCFLNRVDPVEWENFLGGKK